MIVKRQETKSPDAPVGFYKTIAISFLVITVVLLGFVLFIISKKATINIFAKEDLKKVNMEVQVGNGDYPVSATVTSTDFTWSNTYYPTGVEMIESQAEGMVTIYNKQNRDQILIATTRLLTPDGVLFRMKNREVIPANGELEVEVYADEKGDVGNIGPSQFTIPGLSESLQSVVYAESFDNMSGGLRKIGILSEEDLQAAKESYKKQVKQEFLKENDIDEDNTVLEVSVGDISSDEEVGQEVDSFVLTGESKIILIQFDKQEMEEYVEEKIISQIDRDLEKLLKTESNVDYDLVDFNLSQESADIMVVKDVVVTLDANAQKLNIINFAGKRKDEIERYVLSIDHVKDVEVKFSPGWMRTAPSVADKIKVVVKSGK